MDASVVVIAVILDVSLLLLLAAWAARGGTDRMVMGLVASLVFGAIVGVPVYAAAYLLLRGPQRGRSASQATAKVAASKGPLLPGRESNGGMHNARLLAALASLVVGALYVVQHIMPTYHPAQPGVPSGYASEIIVCTDAAGVHRTCLPTPDMNGYWAASPVPDSWVWPHAALSWPTVILEGAVVAILAFLAIAALRWAWRSYR